MNDTDVVRSSARGENESADWRPFNVWAAQVRAGQSSQPTTLETQSEAPRETWDPYSVWKRQVRQS
ncbi:MAG: hypothetical protein AB8G16_03875 [Gammaproteobacteria bacterium]